MKKSLLILLSLTIVFSTKAQFVDPIKGAIDAATGGATNVVHDPINNAKLVEGISQARKTYEIIKKEKELLEDTKKALEKVSTSLRQVKYVNEIIDIQDQIYQMHQENLEIVQALKVGDDGYIVNLVNTMNNTLTSLESSLNLLNHILTDDLFNMSEADRIEQLRSIKQEALDYRATAVYLRKQIQYYATNHYLNTFYTRSTASGY